jgi:hypothetical protein
MDEMVRIRQGEMEAVDKREITLGSISMPIAYLHGLELKPEDLEMIRAYVDESETIDAIDPEIRAIVARRWPHLLSKQPPGEL